MDIEEYTGRIHLRSGPSALLVPSRRLLTLARPLILPRTRFWLECLITSLPQNEHESRQTLASLSSVPRMSTFAIGAIIDKSVRDMDPNQAFLNIGVWNGFTLFAGLIGNPSKVCIGVDNFSGFGGPREAFLERFKRLASPSHHFYERDFREYLRRVHRGSLGVYYYDGPHDYASQLEALELAAPFFAKGCVILVDDTNRPDTRKATLDFVAKSAGQYRVILDVSPPSAEDPVWWDGLMMLRKIG